MTERLRRDPSIDSLRGIAVLLMIAGHVGFGAFANNYIHAFHMPLFYFVSGLVFKPERYDSFLSLAKKLFRRLIVPYLVVGLFHCLLQCVIEWISGDEVLILKHLLEVCWVNNDGFPIAGALWFLTSLFWVQLFVYGFWRLFCGKTWWMLLACVAVFCACIPLYRYNTLLPWSLMTTMAGAVFFAGAMALKKHFDKILSWAKLPLVLLALAASVVLSYINGEVNLRECNYGRFAPLFLAVAFLIVISLWVLNHRAWQWEFRITKKLGGVLANMGKDSLVYVFINALAIRLVQFLAGLFLTPHSTVQVILLNLAIFAVATTLMYCFAKLLSKTPIRKLF